MYCSCLDLELVAGSQRAMSLKDLSFPLAELTWDHFYVVQEELGLSETETDRVLTQVLGPCPDDYDVTWQPQYSINVSWISLSHHNLYWRDP